MKRVLVTGAGGFIGRACLAPLAERGYDVHATGRSAAPPGVKGVGWHGADLLDPTAMGALIDTVRPTHLLHMAWHSEPSRYWTAPQNLRWVGASLALLEAFTAAGGQRAAFAGSCAEYEWVATGPLCERTSPTRPASLYGASKHALQTVASAYSGPAGLSLAWGRLFYLYGPWEQPCRLVASMIRTLLAGEPATCRHGDYVRDFLHVADAGSAFAALLDSEVIGPVNVASGTPVCLGRVAGLIAEAAGHPELLEVREDPLAPGDAPVVTADPTRLVHEVRWSPAFDLESGIGQSVRWWRERSGEAS